MIKSKINIVVYDDLCVLCTWSVRFIIGHDPEGIFYFASLSDPDIGSYLEKKTDLTYGKDESVILINDKGIYFHSDAALYIVSQLKSGWSFLRIFLFIPKFIRDAVYKIIAKYRYRVWGRLDSCWLPANGEKYRFEYSGKLKDL